MNSVTLTHHACTPPRAMTAMRFAMNAAPRAERDTLSDLLVLMGAGAHDPGRSGEREVPVVLQSIPAGQALFREGTAAHSIYFVRSGTFKIFRTAEDGYEQVLGFAGRGEVIGFDAVCTEQHPTATVALEASSVYTILLRDLFVLGERSAALGRAVHRAVSNALACHRQIADVMAAVAAEVRLARFLIQLSRQMAAQGRSPHRFYLRMSRRDIASYIGVAHETISRSFTELAHWGLVNVDNREIDVLDMDGLQALSQNTRRQVDGSGRPLERRQTLPPCPANR